MEISFNSQHKCIFQDKMGRRDKCLLCGKDKPATTEIQKIEAAKFKKTVAIDFDGVIHKYSKGWHDGTCYDVPMAGAFDRIQSLLTEYNVIILSTRNPFHIADWLKRENALFDFEVIPSEFSETFWNKDGVVGITNKKLVAFVYIDDRAYRFVGWDNLPDNLNAYV